MELTEKEVQLIKIFESLKELLRNNTVEINFLVEITDKKSGERQTYKV